MAIPPLFDKKASKVGGFVTVCKSYLMRGSTVEKWIQWILTYVQGKLEDV